MSRHKFDKSSKWMVEHYGDGILHLAGIEGVRRWRSLQSEVVQPTQLPDGLLEVQMRGETKPDYFLLEIATYPEKRVLDQAMNDLWVTSQQRRVVPELVVVVLHPKGKYRVPREHERRSRLGWSRIGAGWKVVELWTLPAEQLLAASNVGLVPWATLAQFSGPPEQLLERCRDRIEKQAPAADQDNLLAVSQVLARLRYPNPELFSILGGERVMIESPLLKEIVAKASQKAILRCLEARFGAVPPEVAKRLRKIQSEKRLDQLIDLAATCKDMKAFRDHLLS